MKKCNISSIESFSTLDGPGIRTVFFFQGCHLRCWYCHNPETWSFDGGKEYSLEEIEHIIRRNQPYFGEHGGITFSGGEPLLHAEFMLEVMNKNPNIHFAIETSGFLINEKIEEVVKKIDFIILDFKFTNDLDYKKYTLCEMNQVIEFLQLCQNLQKKIKIRHVIVPSLNDSCESIDYFLLLKERFSCIEEIEILPFHKMCEEKYERLNLPFPCKDCQTPSPSIIDFFQNRVNSFFNQ